MALSVEQARAQLRGLELFRECKDTDLDRVAALALSRVGEMGLLDQAPRTATVVARTPVVVQVIDARSFERLLDEAPTVTRALLRQVAGDPTTRCSRS